MSRDRQSLSNPPAADVAGDDQCEPQPPRSASLALDVIHDDGDWSAVPDIELLVKRAADALARHPAVATDAPAIACLALSSDAAVAVLNQQHRGKAGPTNVLSFPAGPCPPGPDGAIERFLGDIVFADGVVGREAAEMGLPMAHHVQHLVVHGLLHLLGHDHESDAEAAVMERIETEVLATLGIADPYAPID